MRLKVSIQVLFVIFTLFFGLIYSIITPPFQSVDEANHFIRAYAISEKQFSAFKQNDSVGTYLPAGLSELENQFSYLVKNIDKKTSFKQIKKAFNTTDKNEVFINYPNTALYSPVAYVAQSMGILSGKIFHAPFLLMFYLARIFNLFLYCIFGYYALKNIPYLKLLLFVLLLSPMNISLAASCSSDVTLIGGSFLLFALILKYTFSEQKITVKNQILLSAILFAVIMTKHNFYSFLLLFIIPKEKIPTRNLFLIMLPSIIGCGIWSYMIKDLYVQLNPDANMYRQISFIINNPFNYFIVLIKTTIIKFFRLFITSIGVLGWQDTRLDNITYIIYPFILYLSLIYSGAKNFIINKFQKSVIYFTVISAYVIITTYLYLVWSKVGSEIITGLNGKYYTPILLPLFTLIASYIKTKQPKIFICKTVYTLTALILTSAAISILIRFYDLFPNLYYKV